MSKARHGVYLGHAAPIDSLPPPPHPQVQVAAARHGGTAAVTVMRALCTVHVPLADPAVDWGKGTGQLAVTPGALGMKGRGCM